MALTLESVVAGYGSGDILKGVSLEIEEGSVTCIVGPNGAGKSTVLRTISGLLRPRKGEIRYRGRAIGGMTPRQVLGQGIVQVPQEHSLFTEMTVRENVRLGGYMLSDSGRVRKKLAEIEETFPLVKERAGERAGSLSGGQQRMVEFARCLMVEPGVILLDEPSMGLDPNTRKQIFEMVRGMHELGKTIVLVEQNVRAGFAVATQGVVMENGVVRLEGLPERILGDGEIGDLYLGGSLKR